jgi:lysophospholipid acyltransferase (LPLAT)-like uncharacterized protein
MFRRVFLPWIAWIFFRLWSMTWRLVCIESEGLKKAIANGEPIVFAHWHGDELKILPLIKPYKVAAMTSTSKDGQLVDFAVRRLGGATSRGSSTRGGIGALKGMIRLMGEGYRASMAVDGPKGPLHKVKPGVLELSRLAKAQIVPLGAATDRKMTFHKSWNKAELPKPFAKIVVWFGEPLPVVTRDESAKAPELALRLEGEIAKSCQRALENLR